VSVLGVSKITAAISQESIQYHYSFYGRRQEFVTDTVHSH